LLSSPKPAESPVCPRSAKFSYYSSANDRRGTLCYSPPPALSACIGSTIPEASKARRRQEVAVRMCWFAVLSDKKNQRHD